MSDWHPIRELLLGHGVPLGELPAALATAYGDRPALVAPGGTPGLRTRGDRTFREFAHDVEHMAAAHLALGAPGERVALLLENRLDTLLHVFALARAGAIAVPVNPRLRAPEVAAVLAATGARRALVDGDVAARVFPQGPPVGLALAWSGAGPRPPAAAAFADALAPLPSGVRLPPTASNARDVHAVAVVLATSGTTGHPKAAELTSHGMLSLAGRLLAFMATGRRGGTPGPFRVVSALPLAHVMGLSASLIALSAGALVIHRERFDPVDVLTTIAAHDANTFVGVPTMYADLEPHLAGRDLSGVHLWVSAADLLPPERARRFQRVGSLPLTGRRVGTATFADVYGMVELSGPMALRLYLPGARRGRPLPPLARVLPGFEARVVGESGEALGPGRVGHLEVRGAAVLKAYSGAVGDGPSAQGWFATGDLARLWPGGFFSLVGRSRDRLKVGGFSVFPGEVEVALRQHPDVVDVALVGVPDARLGERPVALVVARDGATFDPDAFIAWASRTVAGYRRPRAAWCVAELPRGPNGKIDRARAAALALERCHALTRG